MRTMNPVSVETYHEKVKPILKESQQEVFEVLKRFDRLTSYEVLIQINIRREKAGLQPTLLHKVSGRFSELKDMELIIPDGRRKIGDSTFTIWQVVKPKPVANPGTQSTIPF